MRTGLWEFTVEKITNPELKTYPSLALHPFNYSLSTNLSFPEFTHFSPPFLMLFLHASLPLSLPRLHGLGICLFRQNLRGHSGAADVRNTGSAGCYNIDGAQRRANLWDLWSYVHSLCAGGQPREEDKRCSEGSV